MELPNPLNIATPALILLGCAEAAWIQFVQKRPYPWRHAAMGVAVWIGVLVTSALSAQLTKPITMFAYEHRIATISMSSAWSWVALLLASEFLGYWFHRLSHSVKWFWANHSVHHEPEVFILGIAYQLPWLTILGGVWIFFLPLYLVGFPPDAVVFIMLVGLVYAFWLHTELVPRMPVVEWVFMTPSLHRVHHSRRPEHLDRNFGGTLSIFDRLFGTYTAESTAVPVEYGLLEPLEKRTLFTVVFHGWIRLLKRPSRRRDETRTAA